MPPKHRSAVSQDTNASAIAASMISFQSLRLSQFPEPPTEIPPTPLNSEFGSTRSFRSLTPPSSPRRPLNPQSPPPLRPKEPPSTLKDEVNSPRQTASSGASELPPTTPTSARLPHGLIRSTTISPQLLALSPSISPYDWHEGASSIDVDPTEDQLLSTSFITALLSSTEFNRQYTSSPLPNSLREGPKPHSQLHTTTNTPRLTDHLTIPHTDSLTLDHPITTPHTKSRVHPLSVDPGGHPTGLSCRAPSYMSADSMTLHSEIGHQSPSVKTTSLAGKLRLRETSTVPRHNPGYKSTQSYSGGSPPHQSDTFLRGHAKLDSTLISDHDFVTDERFVGGVPSMQFSPAFPSTAGTQTHFFRKETRPGHSDQTTNRGSLISRLSTSIASKPATLFSNAFIRRTKPLPPVPNRRRGSLDDELEYMGEEQSIQLISRANALASLLEKDQDPLSLDKRCGDIHPRKVRNREALAPWETQQSPRDRMPNGGNMSRAIVPPKGSTAQQKNKKWRVLAVAFVLFAFTAIGVVVGVTKRRKASSPSCTGNFTGFSCNLDATCVCTSSLPGQCGGLAQSLVSLVTPVNNLFNANFSPSSVSMAIWESQGAPANNNCAPQALLVDVSPALNSGTSPNRTEWAQSALLWTFIQSQNLTAMNQMRSFVLNAQWKKLNSIDGPTSDSSSEFQTSISGFVFDFATQTVSQPNVSFASDGQPTVAQLSQVGPVASAVLDQMYSYALASSTQRQNALAIHWKTVLRQRPEDLPTFLSAINASPMLVPFDATSPPVTSLLTNQSTADFPPPLACYPNLNSKQITLMNTLEHSIFGLPPISPNSTIQFNSSCFPNRPIYGVLDVLQLRLPFLDSRTGVAKQAAVLAREVSPRIVVYSGEILSALPNTSDTPNITQVQTNPRQYGTMNHLNHVVLNYLTSITDVNVAMTLVDYVLSSPTVPPANTTTLYQSLASIPTIELAIFGSITPPDISSSVSSFTTPSNSLFFGSDQSASLRNWAIVGTGSSIAWTEFATSPEVVRDSSMTNSTFSSVWNPAFTYLHSHQSGVTVTVSNITNAFQAIGLFSP